MFDRPEDWKAGRRARKAGAGLLYIERLRSILPLIGRRSTPQWQMHSCREHSIQSSQLVLFGAISGLYCVKRTTGRTRQYVAICGK